MTVTTPPSTYAQPGQPGAAVKFEARYDHFIGGEYVAPASGQYFENPSPVNGKPFTEVARGNAQDVDRDRFYKQILGYAGIVVAVGPLLAWLVFVVVPAVL